MRPIWDPGSGIWTHAEHKASWWMETGWPYYFVPRRGGAGDAEEEEDPEAAAAAEAVASGADLVIQLKKVVWEDVEAALGNTRPAVQVRVRVRVRGCFSVSVWAHSEGDASSS